MPEILSPLDQFDVVKCVVFLETRPLSDEFQQMMLSKEAMKEVNDVIQKYAKKHHKGGYILLLEEDHTYTFKDIKDCFTPEEIKKGYEEDDK